MQEAFCSTSSRFVQSRACVRAGCVRGGEGEGRFRRRGRRRPFPPPPSPSGPAPSLLPLPSGPTTALPSNATMTMTSPAVPPPTSRRARPPAAAANALPRAQYGCSDTLFCTAPSSLSPPPPPSKRKQPARDPPLCHASSPHGRDRFLTLSPGLALMCAGRGRRAPSPRQGSCGASSQGFFEGGLGRREGRTRAPGPQTSSCRRLSSATMRTRGCPAAAVSSGCQETNRDHGRLIDTAPYEFEKKEGTAKTKDPLS